MKLNLMHLDDVDLLAVLRQNQPSVSPLLCAKTNPLVAFVTKNK